MNSLITASRWKTRQSVSTGCSTSLAAALPSSPQTPWSCGRKGAEDTKASAVSAVTRAFQSQPEPLRKLPSTTGAEQSHRKDLEPSSCSRFFPPLTLLY